MRPNDLAAGSLLGDACMYCNSAQVYIEIGPRSVTVLNNAFLVQDAKVGVCRNCKEITTLPREVARWRKLFFEQCPEVHLYVDGACSPNPGTGGWGVIEVMNEQETQRSGAERHTTNNRMELTALIEGLALVPEHARITVYSDSQYVIRTAKFGGQRIANKDLWKKVKALMKAHQITWVHIPGHSGHLMNDRVDQLARAAATALKGQR